MANTPDMATCFQSAEHELLPLSPFYSLSYHFGMLLGVDDFETEQAYHRAKMRLHNAWLHREGVVWGFDVRTDVPRGEIGVLPGLALDAAGHELHLESEACLNVAEWFAAHREDAGVDFTETDADITFDAHVVIRFKACLTRQVPALSEPCEGAGTSTAYSRVFETVEILLRPGLAPDRAYPYHRLRLLFGLEDAHLDEDGNIKAEDQEVLDALADIHAEPPADQPVRLLDAFRRFAAFDEIDLQPATAAQGEKTLLFPATDDEPVVLANIGGITLQKQDSTLVLAGGEVDVTVRPSHVATSTIQELLCGPACKASGLEENESEGEAEGPRVDPDSVRLAEAKKITFEVDAPLHPASVSPAAFAVGSFDDGGWHKAVVQGASFDADSNVVTLTLKSAPAGKVVRLIARGTGETPLLGENLVPLAGAVGGPPVSKHDGIDFVFMHERS